MAALQTRRGLLLPGSIHKIKVATNFNKSYQIERNIICIFEFLCPPTP
jgi:hypothetical protein